MIPMPASTHLGIRSGRRWEADSGPTPAEIGKELLTRGMHPIFNRHKLADMPFAFRPLDVATIRGAYAHGGSECP